MDKNYLKKKLEEEKGRLEARLSKIAQKNPQNPEDWETKPEDMNIMMADQSEVADSLEEFGDTNALENEMEDRLNEVKASLQRLKDGTYGKCEVDGGAIEEDRLEADPTATTCIKHADHI